MQRSSHPPAEAGLEERLQRTLARAGYGSRRSVEALIREGRVTVDGDVAELGSRVDPRKARIAVDGSPVPSHPELRHYALNKPLGVTTTLRDRHAERTLDEFLPEGPRLFPVGRLDRESEGLLLLTNDGELANRLLHPRYGVEREYLAEVAGTPPRSAVRALEEGVQLEDGLARAVRAARLQVGRDRAALSIVMIEGRNREVRRMLAVLGYPVRRLVRVRIDGVRLESLPPGAVRPLTSEEVRTLHSTAGLATASPRPRR